MVALNLRFFRAAALLLCLVMMLTVSGVYAIWVFPEMPLPPISDVLGLDMGGHMGEISVYKTVMEKTDIWRGTVSYLGHAQVKGLTEMGASPLNEKETSVYSIDVPTWHHTHTD